MNVSTNIPNTPVLKVISPAQIAQEMEVHEWQPPQRITPGLHPVLTLPIHQLPSCLREYVEDSASRMNAPADFAAMAALIAIGAATRGQIQIRPKQNDTWSEFPNLWGLGIGHPSVMKSPSTSEMFKVLAKIEAKFADDYKVNIKDWEIQGKLLSLTLAGVEKRMKAGEASEDDYLDAQRKISNHEERKPIQKRLLVNDATTEKLAEILIASPGLLVYRDEILGLLKKFNQAGKETDRAFFLEGWKGTSNYAVDRIGRGSQQVPLLLLAVFGTIQPGALLDYFSDLAGDQSGDGLIQRFQLMVYPDKADFAYVDRKPNAEARARYFSVIENIAKAELKAYTYEDAYADVPYLHFNQEAQQVFVDWYQEFYGFSIQQYQEQETLETHFSKYRKLVPALALIFHLADLFDSKVNGKQIEAIQVHRAIAFAEYLESHAKRIFGLFTNAHFAGAETLSKRLLSKKLVDKFSARDVVRQGWKGLSDQRQVEKAINELLNKNWIKEVESAYAGTGRPAAPAYEINPLIFHEIRQTPTDKTDRTRL